MGTGGGFQLVLLCFVILVLFPPSGIIPAIAQETTPPPEKRGVQLLFAQPPMEGTISMGIYDSTGKLVRVLHQDAPTTDFFPALNGLITFWDGKDDSGKPMPAGKYHAKGYMMADMDFDGVAFLGNDFVDKDGNVKIKHIDEIAATKKGNLWLVNYLQPTESDPKKGMAEVCLDPAGDFVDIEPAMTQTLVVKDGKIVPIRNVKAPEFSAVEHPVDICDGRGGTFWVIDGTDIKQLSPDGEILRHLAMKEGSPAPVRIQASPVGDEIYVLEQNDKLQRVRGLALLPGTGGGASPSPSPPADPAQKSSLWKVTFDKTIIFSDKIEQALPLLKMADGKPFVPQDKIPLKLQPNPLENDKPGALDVAIGIDAKGSFIKTLDGLPLCRVSDTPNLKWAVIALEADGKTVTIFQSDGSVVEQYKATKLANMAGFDAGDFDFDPANMK